MTTLDQSRPRVHCHVAVLLALGLTSSMAVVAPRAGAQDAEGQSGGDAQDDDGEAAPPAPPSSDALHPPQLERPLEIVYPPEARAAGAEGVVVLVLVIDTSGTVSECTVERSAGRQDLDDAACTLLRATHFVPARRGDTPIPARIRFGVEYALSEPIPPDTEASEAEGEPEPPTAEEPPSEVPEIELAATDEDQEEPAFEATAVVRIPRVTELRRSAEAVQVVELDVAAQQGADLGEVLARQQGIGVRRSGGLGSTTRFSLNGLTDDQIRFFLDGITVDWMGFPFGIADIPVNLVDHVEVYRGVVPIRFGSDALGGAVNLASRDPAYSPHASFSYQGGSFGTHRLTLEGGHLFAENGVYVRGRAFVDRAENDYRVTVQLSDDMGRPYEERVRRPHDGYAAQGGSVEVGVTDVPYADRLSLRAFVTDYTREVQHNVTMAVPYGEVEYGETTGGAVLRYENGWDRGSLSAVLAYNYSHAWFTDVSACTYDWFRRCIAELRPGEVGRSPSDQRRRTHAGILRLSGEYQLTDEVTLRASLAPTFSVRTGEELADGESVLAPIDLRGDFFTMVAGVEAELNTWNDRLQAVAFAKYYTQALWSDVIVNLETVPIEDSFHQPGVGSALRLLFTEDVYLKVSYEWATRLLRVGELFGNGALIYPNLELRPEVSHNVNAGLTAEGSETRVGVFRADVNLFLRRPERLVILLGSGEFFQFQNVNRARSLGFEVAGGWTSPRDYVSLDANLTYQDFRNVSDQGIFGAYDGDRIPNRPYLFANLTGRLQFDDVLARGDRVTLSYYLRFVYEFFRNWESVGANRPDIKQTIDTQVLHTVAATYLIRVDARELALSLEAQNLTNANAFDTFGVQRPGRAVYFKVSGEF